MMLMRSSSGSMKAEEDEGGSRPRDVAAAQKEGDAFSFLPWRQLPEGYVPPRRPYDPVYDSPAAKRIADEWWENIRKEKPPEDAIAFWLPWVLLAFVAVFVFPAMTESNYIKARRKTKRMKAREAARTLISRLKNFGKEEAY
ncbi:hypothetical protein AK812_SmicGene17628 [Symbiodinium microadriaticum]|uniref:Uncharacterized protein n=1 Tax=Symbiodinium microadriaticum TaxID=2951 RepID=A0A1Q9DXA0_SYMMI|nr:hypothetical protein AK812_SmicGene17628 [Symbiodinium microadriaticum]